MVTGPGVYDIPMGDYLADPCPEPSVSRSTILTLLTRSPMHARLRHPRLGGLGDRERFVEPSDAEKKKRMARGSAAHAILLGGEEQIVWLGEEPWLDEYGWIEATQHYGGKPEWKRYTGYGTNAAKAERDAARAAGLVPMLVQERGAILDMAGVAMEALQSRGWYGRTEQTLIWTEGSDEDGEAPVWCRARPDIYTETDPTAPVIDYKRADNAEPETWSKRSILGIGLDIQAAGYTRALEWLEGFRREFVFMVQEPVPPFAISWVGAGPDVLDYGNKRFNDGLAVWRRCVASGVWPAYPQEIHWAGVPGWAQLEIDDVPLTYGGQPLEDTA